MVLEADVSQVSEIGCVPRQLAVVIDDLCLHCLWRRHLFYVSVRSFLTLHSYMGRKARFHFPIFLRKKTSGIMRWALVSHGNLGEEWDG